MTIPLFSAAAAYPGLDLPAILRRVHDSHWYVLGQEGRAFEQAFADYTGVEHCVGVANGTDALELALRAAGVRSGDVVATVANAGFYSSTAILAIGAQPLYLDVDPATYTLAPAALAAVLDQRPAAVVVTHLYGRLADMEAICHLTGQAGIPLIEDCAQAHGAQRNGRRAGSFGTLSCFSFYPTKNLGALGDGGAVCSQDADLAARVRQLRQYGWSDKYHVALPGGRNSRLDELQAAILTARLPHLDAQNAARRAIARRYAQAFADLPLQCPTTGEDDAGHLYVVTTPHRDRLSAWLGTHGIATAIHYPVPDYRQPILAGRLDAVTLPVTERLTGEILTLPCFPGLETAQQDQVIDQVRDFFRTAAA